MQEISLKFVYIHTVLETKLLSNHVAYNRLHHLYVLFSGMRLQKLKNTHSTITIENRTHVDRNLF